MKHCSCNLSHEFNSSLQDDQGVKEESSTAREEVEQEVTEEVDLMYGDETFEEEEEGGEEAGNGDERGGEENLATEEAFEGEQEEEEEDEVRAEVEDKIEEIVKSLYIMYKIYLPNTKIYFIWS